MMSKEKEFFNLAKKMNERFSIIPLLSGSVALSILAEEQVYNENSDIDIAVPHYMRPDRKTICPDLVKFMENEGYKFVDTWEGEFHKGEFMIQINGDNISEDYAHIDITECPIMQTDGAIYKILTLEQIFKSYTVSAECDFRHPNPDTEDINNDRIRAEIARKALERNKADSYKFLLASCDDIPEIVDIYHSLIGTPGCTWDLDYPSRETAEYDINNGFLYVLKDGEKIIAVASAGNFDELGDLQWKLRNPCELARIGVMPTMQKRGIGSILLKYIIKAMADKGYDGMRFTAWKNNLAAITLYNKNGFEKCGEVFRFGRDNCCYQMKFKNQ